MKLQSIHKLLRPSLVLFILSACFVVKAQTWKDPINPSTFASGTTGIVGEYASLNTVNGYPAIAAYDRTHTSLMFVRALDSAGTTWGSPIYVDVRFDVGQYASLFVVNGNPAITYYDATNGDLKYVRAYDASGTVWNSSITISSVSNVGQYASMIVVNGYPAISYYDATAGDLYYVQANEINGATWNTPVKVDGTLTNVGQFTSLAVVNGNPAISYYDVTNGDLDYVQSSDSNGTLGRWGTPLRVDGTSTNVGQYTSLCVANGNPAISYYDVSAGDLKFIRASAADGSLWSNQAFTIDATGNVGQYTSMTLVNGIPNISYFDATKVDLKYVIAADSSGAAWNNSVSIDATDGRFTSLAIINDRPAVAYYNGVNGNLRYQRAASGSGSNWGGTITSVTVGSDLGQYNNLKVVKGNPAMAYYDATNQDLIYIRASNVQGSTWGAPKKIDSTGNVGSYLSLCLVKGNPAISYYDATNRRLRYVRAMDSTGTTWGAAVTVDSFSSTNVGQYTSLCIINGKPAISYYDVTNQDLLYVSASDSTGSTWGSPARLASTGNVGQSSSLCQVNGKAAISYWDATINALMYTIAADISATSWSSISLYTKGGRWNSLCVVKGFPAIAFYDLDGQTMRYIRATDADGTQWGQSISFVQLSSLKIGQYVSMTIVGGYPAISTYAASGQSLKYLRASDSTGSSWASVQTLDATSLTGQYTSLAVNEPWIYVGFYNQDVSLPSMVEGVTTNTWLGNNSNWNDVINWRTNLVPVGEDVTIPGGVPYYPIINTDSALCNNLTIASGASVTVSGTAKIKIGGNITNSGTLDVSAGTVEFNGSSIQTVGVNIFKNNSIKNLVVNSSSIVNLSGTLSVTELFTPTAGVFSIAGKLTLKSNANGTARVGPGSSNGGYIMGDVTIERYIPAKRAWRFLTSPLTGGGFSNKIFYNWQNSGVINGTGIELWTTSANGGTSNPTWANSGLAVANGNSILSYTSGVGWTPVTNTNTTKVFNTTNNYSYCVFVTGPYGAGNGNINNGASSPTTIIATGALRTGNITVSAGTIAANKFYLVGNPYASPVNPAWLTGANLSNAFYIWDPYLTGVYGVGGYVTYDRTLNQYNVTTASYSNDPNSHIQSGQAFLIQASATAATSITFKESDKSSTVNNNQFRTNSNGFENVNIILQKDFEGTGTYTNTDGAVASFHATIGSKDIDSYDVTKMNSGIDLLSLVRGGTNLAFEHRPLVTDKDTIYLKLSNTSISNYRFAINAEDFVTMAGLTAVLKDNYLNTETNLNLTGATTTINFNVTSDAATTGIRFVIYFRPSSVLPVDFMSISAKAEGSSVRINWNVASQKNVARYEVERSGNSNNFEKMGSVNSANTSSYNFTDAHPNTGANYYRIRRIDVNGSSKLSSVVTVKLNGESQFSIYPNPVKDRKVEINLSDATAGKYTLRLINATGQVLFTKRFDHSGGSITMKLDLPKDLPVGSYEAEFVNGSETKIQQIIVY